MNDYNIINVRTLSHSIFLLHIHQYMYPSRTERNGLSFQNTSSFYVLQKNAKSSSFQDNCIVRWTRTCNSTCRNFQSIFWHMICKLLDFFGCRLHSLLKSDMTEFTDFFFSWIYNSKNIILCFISVISRIHYYEIELLWKFKQPLKYLEHLFW